MKILRKSKKLSRSLHRQESGFTIIELLISSSIFALVLLLSAFAIMHVGKMFYKGVITNRTQEVARKLSTDVHQGIVFGEKSDIDKFHIPQSDTYSGIVVNSHCLGEVRYSYINTHALGTGAGKSPHVLWKDRNEQPGCEPVDITVVNPLDPVTSLPSDGVELLAENMRIPVFDISHSGTLWSIVVRVAYADSTDLFEGGDPLNPCLGTTAGGQFCAVSEFSMNARKRL